jgi:hypothetical protein
VLIDDTVDQGDEHACPQPEVVPWRDTVVCALDASGSLARLTEERPVDIHYLNTDLDLAGPNDLRSLTTALESRGIVSLHSARGADGLWRARFETATQYEEPAETIADLLAAIETLLPLIATDWWGCTLREFNVGYDCGRGPWAFTQGLPNALLRRMADAGMGLRITIYPEDREQAGSSTLGDAKGPA